MADLHISIVAVNENMRLIEGCSGHIAVTFWRQPTKKQTGETAGGGSH
ncbi:MAG: hypothetical protein V4793_15700 [Paraburkholderia tropica]